MGACLLVIISTVNGTELGTQEYGINTSDLQFHCDGCGSAFSLCHTLDCQNGGLIMAHQNELHDGVVNLAEKFFTPAHVRNNYKIFTGRAVQGRETKEKEKGKCTEAPPPEEVEEKEDLLIRDLWTQGTESIHVMRVVNTDAVSYQSKTPEKCLETAKREKKKKYLNAYLNDHQHFTPFVALVDGPLGVEAEATL